MLLLFSLHDAPHCLRVYPVHNASENLFAEPFFEPFIFGFAIPSPLPTKRDPFVVATLLPSFLGRLRRFTLALPPPAAKDGMAEFGADTPYDCYSIYLEDWGAIASIQGGRRAQRLHCRAKQMRQRPALRSSHRGSWVPATKFCR